MSNQRAGVNLTPDPRLTAWGKLAEDVLREHLRRHLDRILEAGWDRDTAVDAWREHWAGVLDSIVADADR